ncbi:hypothetical protein R3P38DRAFT_2840920 [Favolaschia claudopus]|uniref:Uncharacterized protein n=1 Tax=Favolaschia claudopus TaxID=2862362 RepID=A0AAW0DWF0_9AGAR
MSSRLLEIRARTFRYVGSRCYNERNQLIACPFSKTKAIAIAVAVGALLIICLTLVFISKCGGCRRRRETVPTLHYSFARDPEAAPPVYHKFESSTERLVLPASPSYQQFDHLSTTGPYHGYLPPPASTDTLVEPARIHAADHTYPRY